MRIGMILDKNFPPDPRVRNEALALIRSGFEVFLFCTTREKSFVQQEVIDGINVRRYHMTEIARKSSIMAYPYPFYKWLMKGKIKHFLKAVNPDVIHIHDMSIGGTVVSANRSFNCAIVLDLHENRPEIFKFYAVLKTFLGRLTIYPSVWKRAEEKLVRAVDRIVVVTELSKNELVRRVGIPADKIIVASNNVDEAFYTNPTIDESIIERYKGFDVLLYIGDTSKRRGLSTAIEALPRILKVHPKTKLVILGKSSFDSELVAVTARLALEDAVDFIGYVDSSFFQSYISASKIGISPLHINEHHNTTHANKIFQYLSLGVPILVSNVTAQEVLVDSFKVGYVHKAEDAEDFAEKAILMFDNENECKEFGENGKRLVREEYLSKNTFKSLTNYYSTFVKN